MLRRFLFLVFSYFLFAEAFVKEATANPYYFDYNTACASAYKNYLSLKVPEGDAIIRRELISHPYNLAATYIADYGDAIPLLFHGDPYQYDQRQAHQEDRLSLIARAADDQPWKRLAQAGILMHWAIIRLRRGEELKAASGIRRSYQLLKENEKKFAGFRPDDVLYGAAMAMADIIPDSYKWLASMLGMGGDLQAGIGKLGNYLRQQQAADLPFFEEAMLYQAYIRFNFGGEKDAVWQFVSDERQFPLSGNPMRAFFRANLGLSYRKAEISISSIKTVQSIPAAQAFPIFDFEMGSALLLKLDMSCLEYFDRFLSRNKGNVYIKDALQMAALAAYANGDQIRADKYRKRILSEGSTLTDADRQALRFAKSGSWPHPTLLRARLLIDGGYPAQALALLQGTKPATFSNPADRVEYDFRSGRALEDTRDAAAAVQAYQKAINAGRNRPEYFAARSALQMAGIYEARRQYKEARHYYNVCLSMRDHDFQASIDQQAKAGLARIGA